MREWSGWSPASEPSSLPLGCDRLLHLPDLSVHQGEVGAAEHHPAPHPAPRAELGVSTDTLPSQLCGLIALSLES